ncbi:MAG: polyhydroxyalkanoic acid system family protein [Rhodoblastus sp.]
MAKPIVVTVSHSLGAAEAQRRISRGLEKGRAEFSALFSAFDAQWRANHCDIGVVALRQRINAGLDVFDDVVRVEVSLPWYLAPLQDKIVGVLRHQGQEALRLGRS